jgi:hypothetical protein
MAVNAFWKERNQWHAAELFGVPHSCLQKWLHSGFDRQLRNK